MKYLFWKTEDNRYYYSTENGLKLEIAKPARLGQANITVAKVIDTVNFWIALNAFRVNVGLEQLSFCREKPRPREGEINDCGGTAHIDFLASALIEPKSKADFICQDFRSTLAKSKVLPLLQSLAICNGSIIGMSTLTNGFSEKDVRYWEIFLKLKFRTKEDIIRFHGMGFATMDPPIVTGC